MTDGSVLVAGAGGFVGGALVAELRRLGLHGAIRAVDVKPVETWCRRSDDVEELELDLRDLDACRRVTAGADEVYNLACDMGGIGFLENHRADCMLSVLINSHMLLAARDAGVERYFFSSSACVYAAEKQRDAVVTPLREEDAYPAMPEDGYGWEKLFSERMCRHFREDYGLETRVARYHNVYGPHGTWDGGREKAPAAICRKVVDAIESGSGRIEIWGDGRQTRSFTYVDDCIYGTTRILASDVVEPINLGSDELVTIDGLVDLVEDIAGVRLERSYRLDAPRGVNGRNSDNTRIRKELGWAPGIRLRDGLERTFEWIRDRYRESRVGGSAEPAPTASR